MKCTCKKAGIQCSKACKHCNGESCQNSKVDKEFTEIECNEDDIENEENDCDFKIGQPEINNFDEEFFGYNNFEHNDFEFDNEDF